MDRVQKERAKSETNPRPRARILRPRALQTGSPAPAIQVFTLRPFQILVNGEPLKFAVRAQRKPLALLKALLALGAEDVTEQVITDALWPDSEGDAAHSNFAATLHRLRKLLGQSVLLFRDGKLTLDPAWYWSDCRAFAEAMGEVEEACRREELDRAYDRIMEAMGLYRRPFLDGETDPPEIGVMRERLHGLLLGRVAELARRLRVLGDLDRVIALCGKGLEADPVAEELHRILIRAYAAQGRSSDARAAYERCREMLRQQWGIDPSPETEAVFQELSQSRNQGADPKKASASIRAEPERPSIAVLPFTNLSGDPGQEYFSDGFSEDLITQLARIPGLVVSSRHSAFTFKGRAVDAREVGRELGVSFLLEGSVRKVENRIRISAQLIETKSGGHLWAESFDREAERMFDVQDQIIEEIAGRLNAEIERELVQRARRKAPSDLKAYDLVLQSLPLQQDSGESNHHRARDLLERAVSLDPNYALALAKLSNAYIVAYKFRWTAETDLLERGFEAARKAVALDPLDSRARVYLAQAHFYRREISKFDTQVARALALNPHDSWAWFFAAFLNACIGRLDESMRMADRAMRLDPHHSGHYHWVPANYHYINGRFEEALEAVLRVDAPSFSIWHAWLAAIYGQQGRLDEARAEAAEVRRLRLDFDLAAHYRRSNMPEENIRKLLAGARKAGLV